MRINKFIASSGLCSRRSADELIKNGNVRINGKVLKELGYEVSKEDEVTVNGKYIFPVEKKLYFILNKPVGYVTTMKDEKERPAVSGLIPSEEGRVFPVGRLDFNTSGLLIINKLSRMRQMESIKAISSQQ